MLVNKEEVVITLAQKALLQKDREKRILEETNLYKIKYLVDDNVYVDGYLSVPVNIKERLPVIIWNRGGFKEKGRLEDLTAFITLGEIADWGYCVFASQYREDEKPGISDVQDVLTLLQIVKDIPFADNQNIAMEGWSRGGMLTLLCLQYEYGIKTAVVVAGLTDLNDYCKNSSERKLILEYICNKDSGMSISPVNIYKSIKKIPILFIHGTNDEMISYEQSIKMFNLLKMQNPDVNYELELIEGGSHFLKENRDKVSDIRRKWYDKYLKI